MQKSKEISLQLLMLIMTCVISSQLALAQTFAGQVQEERTANTQDQTGKKDLENIETFISRTKNQLILPTPAVRDRFVQVNGVRLHYLDWGGSGETVVFLTGLGDNAHIYDDLAPKFNRHFRVLTLSRRGYGLSSQPQNGYDVETLTTDLMRFLDALGIQKAHFVGHSIAGNELIRFAARFPERVGKLVFLDAGIDYSGGSSAQSAANPADSELEEPQPTPADLSSFYALRTFAKRISPFWMDANDTNLLYSVVFNDDGSVGRRTPVEIDAKLIEGATSYSPEYGLIAAKTLAIISIPGSIFDILPWLECDMSAETRQMAEYYLPFAQNANREQAARLRQKIQNSRVVELEDSTHYLFLEKQKEIECLIYDFLKAG